MFGRRKVAKGAAPRDQERDGPAEAVSAEALPLDAVAAEAAAVDNGRPDRGAREQSAPREVLSLNTMCACGHARRDHAGLHIDVTGRCLECDCERFARMRESRDSDERAFARLSAAVDRVERLEEAVARLQRQRGNGVPKREQ